MRKLAPTLIPLLAAGLAWACSREVPGTRPGVGGAPEDYDPGSDPLVNPPTLFLPSPEDNPQLMQEDATLIRRLTNSPTTLNPIFNSLWEDFYLHNLLFVAPVQRNQEMEYVFNSSLVTSWEESPDQRTFTLHLSPQARWHDGRPWTAYDVELSFELMTDDRVPALFYKLNAGRLEEVRALDAHTVEYVHKDVVATRMRDMLFPVVPKHIFDQPAERAKDPTLRASPYFNRHAREEVIGSGPYRLVEWLAHDQLVVERWEDYPFTKPRFKRQVLKIIPDPNIALLLFKKGELHEMSLTAQQFATQTDDDDFRRFGVKGYGPRRMIGSLAWNMDGSNPFFGDVRVRRALGHAFNRRRFLSHATYNLYPPSRGIFDREHWAYNPRIELHSYDLQEAGRLLDEAGWKLSEEDGWRYKLIQGQPVKFEFEMLMGQGQPTWNKLTNIYSEDLRKIGVSLKARFLEVAALIERLRQHDFQSYVAVVEVTNDPDEWNIYWHTQAYRDGFNYVGYSNPRVDELFTKAHHELDREARRASYQEIQQILHDEQPFYFIWDYTLLWAFDNRLRGVGFSASGPFLFYPGLSGWWLARERPRPAS